MEAVFRSQLRSSYQKPNKNLQELKAEISRLVSRAYLTVPHVVHEIVVIEMFLQFAYVGSP